MPAVGKRYILGGRGKGYLSAAGPQFRFIVFLLLVLFAYTLLLKVFQKMAEIVQLTVFLPISLIALLIFIGMVGMLYSHRFVGPLHRIRASLERMAEGEHSICLRLRESDDPLLKELVSKIILLCEHSRSSHVLIQEGARDLFSAITVLQNMIDRGANSSEIVTQFNDIDRKRARLEDAIKAQGAS